MIFSEKLSLFHLAFPVTDLEKARSFYGEEGLGCSLGRSSVQAQIFNFFGHQLIAHLVPTSNQETQKGVYPRHFGIVCQTLNEWEVIHERCLSKKLCIYQPARLRFPDRVIENYVFFLKDPSGNILEFKYYKNEEAIFSLINEKTVGEPSQEDKS